MPYQTRIRSHTDPIPPQRPRQQKQDPAFPPPGLTLHPEDDASKVLHAIAKALLAVNNKAMTIKDLADNALKHGLVCTGSSPINAASQQITTYIRLHQRRCELGETNPLLKSYTLNGTSDDDLLTGALYSRAGGTATRKGGAIDTAFRKGTLVWYLSPETGAPDPFQQAGVRLPGTNKRRRRVQSELISSDSEEEKRPKIKLRIKLSSLTVTRATAASTNTGSSELTPITLVSPTSSPTSSYPLRLPPYPIQSHCRHLLNIPNSPFDLPEYASPPPDSEDDFDDFHTSMMAAVEESDSELPPPSDKDESDSDLEEGSFGRRSRSTSWTTVTDPKTPRDVDKPLSQPTCKIEGDDNSVHAPLSYSWDPSYPSTSDIIIKREEVVSDLAESWMTQHDVEDLVSFEEPFSLPTLSTFSPLIGNLEGPDDEITSGSGPAYQSHNRSISVPVTWHRRGSEFLSTADTIVVGEDDVEILGPDSVPPEEFDKCLFACRSTKATVAGTKLPNREFVGTHDPPNKVKDSSIRFVIVNGLHLCEVDVCGHLLQKRVDNDTVHLTTLLHLLSNKSPSSDFMQLDGAFHSEDDDSKGTWVPLAFARKLVEGRNIPQQVVDFLDDFPRATVEEGGEHSNVSMSPVTNFQPQNSIFESDPSVDSDSTHLLPAFGPSIKTGVDMKTNDLVQFKFPLRQLPVTFDDDPIWQRDSFTDWKVNLDLDPSLAFPHLPNVVRSVPHSEQVSLHNNDLPLSPQEEEIFHSLVDLGVSKFPDQDRVVETEESVLEADDERDSPKQLRRSKRVAARSETTRARGSASGIRRSARTK